MRVFTTEKRERRDHTVHAFFFRRPPFWAEYKGDAAAARAALEPDPWTARNQKLAGASKGQSYGLVCAKRSRQYFN